MTDFDPLAYITMIMETFYPIGADPTGGVTRLGYSEVEDEMHAAATAIAEAEGYVIETDPVGNLYFSLAPSDEYYLVASHLDSVKNGGRFDGIIGVASGMLLLKMVKEEGSDLPVKVGIFRCEESTNFMKATLASSLITGKFNESDFTALTARDGRTLKEIFEQRGHSLELNQIQGVKEYLELHIEQGRMLEANNQRIGVVTSIAGNNRLKVHLEGLAEHSGATPMIIRQDALCAAAEIVLAVEKIAKDDPMRTSVGTVGVLEITPGSMNVIPGGVDMAIDLRDGDNARIAHMRTEVEAAIGQICEARSIQADVRLVSSSPAVTLDQNVIRGLVKATEQFKVPFQEMPSGAGHDAMNFADLCPTGMVFIPCAGGISHNPEESADYADAVLGTRIMLKYLAEIA
ncbi:M20 family metallo-hydrolase [Ancrocorticia populi]|uniref:Zn-dependent hydrolase n=1 Tax=Ancrocorticia populi TaxID=2175228 RepID=A0A2V1K5S3_9ACTO|nr:M20 family metallo-hydrolase [Ancrocorticia populi]PWF25939.1 Zn-dependent hydrolase [Ancrocorticia populi]